MSNIGLQYREQQSATLIVDSQTATGSSPGSAIGLTATSGQMYVGGIAVSTADLSEYRDILDGDFKMGLVGCIANLEVNDASIDLERMAQSGANVESCDKSK